MVKASCISTRGTIRDAAYLPRLGIAATLRSGSTKIEEGAGENRRHIVRAVGRMLL